MRPPVRSATPLTEVVDPHCADLGNVVLAAAAARPVHTGLTLLTVARRARVRTEPVVALRRSSPHELTLIDRDAIRVTHRRGMCGRGDDHHSNPAWHVSDEYSIWGYCGKDGIAGFSKSQASFRLRHAGRVGTTQEDGRQHPAALRVGALRNTAEPGNPAEVESDRSPFSRGLPQNEGATSGEVSLRASTTPRTHARSRRNTLGAGHVSATSNRRGGISDRVGVRDCADSCWCSTPGFCG